ncbi:hypothetical protein [Kitasatospora sp. NBC_01300]|uniref:hypothetical protein n=1 Tax=Kitasatospora sp. NBC_01300 TaxID=2903574 RepID=UPI002F90FAC8|nr:hypothetical protein OG556_38510 [Kitasatospora sp. NBC_01300]
MAGNEGFGVLVERLADRRHVNLADLARSADVDQSELLTLIRGGAPSPSLLRRLAPALGLHTADLFAIAGVDVPDDLAPVDTKAGLHVPSLVQHVVTLSSEQRDAVRQFVASLPQEGHVQPVLELRAYERYPASPGAVLMCLARNRNLGWSAIAKTFYVVTGRCWSASTYGGVGCGTVPLTPGLLADFSAVLDVSFDDLTALTGVALPDVSSIPEPTAVGVAELLWAVRRLTGTQLRQVRTFAESL